LAVDPDHAPKILASSSLFYPPLLSYETANATDLVMSPGFWDVMVSSSADDTDDLTSMQRTDSLANVCAHVVS
jgi:hypothetical protein